MNSNDHGMGTNVIIEHILMDNTKIYSTYSHLSSYESTLYVGYKVKKGEKIGTKGGSGYGKLNYWGEHLHFELKTKAVTGSPYNGSYYGYTPTNPTNYGYLNPNDFIGKKKAKSNEDLIQNSSISSIFDGAGSLISPNEDCYGCDKDIAKMHPHNGENSTVVFQWLYDTDSCSQLDIFSDESIGDVIIKSKKWDGHLIQKAFKVKLNAGSPITLKRPDNNNKWTTFAITTTEPLNFSNSITAECRTSESRDKKGIRSDVNKDLIDVSHEHFWTGTGSIISFATERGSNQFGIDKDYAVAFDSEKSLTSFQWYSSSSCSKLKIKNARSSSINSPIESIHIKGWAEKDWGNNKCGSTLPCTLDAPDGDGYYVIKVKSDAGAIRFGTIEAQCLQ